MIGRTLREKTSGSGLKMSITKQLTVAHGGEIFESSKLGHGTEIVRRFRL
ncbi:ATP-binding protein [Lysinibacillus sphaericus]|uniref:Two-component sensor histidine kinase n=1 Tax=Lysinibacillus sphaericus OT4b.31 TaxID=1285586 RepID=R7ZAB1_LYSSH|nr:HAMP domain-containing histidine kinase [Lysinibacillus sphaericus]EON71080.1 two-component sensor histidine kinase [Lysinibacillus sphaericus OT4b.31]